MFGVDERGQSVVIGFTLVFAILVTAFVSYQAVIVPQQNEDAEFEHSLSVQNDLTEARSALLNSAFDGDQPSVDVQLGTRYPFRLLALNPAPVSGTVQTTETRPISVTEGGTGVDVCPVANGDDTDETRQLRYSANYNFLDNPPRFAVENTVVYRQYDSAAVTDSGQKLVAGERINLVPIRNEYEENGIATVSVEFVPGEIETTAVTDPTVRVPTRLSEERWEQLLSGEVAAGDVTVDDSGTPDDRTDDVLELTLTGDYTVICTPVGVGGDPPEGARETISDGFTGGDGGGSGADTVNPAGPDSVTLQSATFNQNSNSVDLTFKNNGDEDRTFSRARVAFYYEANKQSEVQSLILNGNTNDEFRVGDALETVDESVTVPAGGTETITLADSGMRKDDLFEFAVEYDDGSNARYFVDVSDQSGGGLAPRLPSEVVYVDGGDSASLLSIGYDGTTSTEFATKNNKDVLGLGAKEANIDGSDGDLEIPYVNGDQDLLYTEASNNQQKELVNTGALKTHLGVGDFDGDGSEEIIFVGSNNQYIKHIDVNDGGTPTTITDQNGNEVTASNIVGYEDFDGDGDKDIIYIKDTNGKIAYFDDGVTSTVNAKPSAALAVGQPADFDGDDDLDVPYKDGSNTISYVDISGNVASVTTDSAVSDGSIATVQNTIGTSNPDVVYVDQSPSDGSLRIIDLSDGTEQQYDQNDEDAQTGVGAS